MIQSWFIFVFCGIIDGFTQDNRECFDIILEFSNIIEFYQIPYSSSSPNIKNISEMFIFAYTS